MNVAGPMAKGQGRAEREASWAGGLDGYSPNLYDSEEGCPDWGARALDLTLQEGAWDEQEDRLMDVETLQRLVGVAPDVGCAAPVAIANTRPCQAGGQPAIRRYLQDQAAMKHALEHILQPRPCPKA